MGHDTSCRHSNVACFNYMDYRPKNFQLALFACNRMCLDMGHKRCDSSARLLPFLYNGTGNARTTYQHIRTIERTDIGNLPERFKFLGTMGSFFQSIIK